MKLFLLIGLLFSLSFSDLVKLSSFEANFIQTITDEKGKVLSYSGTLQALKPQFALWNYKKPVEKRVYIQNKRVSIVEPELEQVIIRRISSDFDFFTLMSNAKKIDKEHYVAKFEDSDIFIELKDSKVLSLSYKDKFDNDVKILFSEQLQNIEISPTIFQASYPNSYDIITD
jgi:outer membrane lipoprotein carrier protein